MKTVLFWLLVPCFTSLASDSEVRLEAASTKVEWTLGDVLHTVHGTFQLMRGDIHFDAATGKAWGEFVVDARSGESGSGARDSRMHKNVLESAKFPQITFAPDKVTGRIAMDGESELRLHGQFTIHGATHEVTMPVKCRFAHEAFTADISFGVPYQQWGMKNPSTLFLRVDDTVRIDIHAAGKLVSAQAGN